ncbi:MAG: hypothetical protein ABR575_04195 [Actinomycetota bacterium]
MRARVVETEVKTRRFARPLRVRIDLHGVSTGAPGSRRVIRWEWIESIDVRKDGLVIRASRGAIELPDGTFGLESERLAELLEAARAIERRADVIGRLSAPPDAERV